MECMLFSKDAMVEIQGDEVLELNSLEGDHAVYQVIGFNNPLIFIRDYRTTKLKEIIQVEETGKVNGFAKSFNSIANVTISRDANTLFVDLNPSRSNIARFMLWITSDFGDKVPIFRYRFFKATENKNGNYRLISLYKRPYQRGVHQPVPFLSVGAT
jgi:hypothetical protein